MKANHPLKISFLYIVLTTTFFLAACHLSSENVLFLVQTGAASFTLLDVKHQIATPYDFPAGNQQYDLAAGLSPNGTQMILPVSDRKVVVLNLGTGEVHTTYDLTSDSAIFQAEQAAEVAKATLPDLNYSDQRLIMALENAYRQSKMNIQWFRNDNYCLSVLDGSATSTHLILDNHQRGTREQLEGKPGLVEDYWVEPGGERILLKKSFLIDPGTWQDDRYFLVDPDLGTASAISLPGSIENPLVFWFTQDAIGIVHQPDFFGGTNFSIVNTTTLESHLVLKGTFTSINILGSNLLSCHQNHENQTTIFNLLTHDGQIIGSQTIDTLCSVKAAVDSHQLLINCEDKSMIIKDEPFTVTPFSDPVNIFSPSPDHSQTAILFNDQSVFQFSEGLAEGTPLQLQETPDEIHWLPDSSGFLYRAMDRLFYHNPIAQEDHLLISSNFFIDYRNLNAVWVHIIKY